MTIPSISSGSAGGVKRFSIGISSHAPIGRTVIATRAALMPHASQVPKRRQSSSSAALARTRSSSNRLLGWIRTQASLENRYIGHRQGSTLPVRIAPAGVSEPMPASRNRYDRPSAGAG